MSPRDCNLDKKAVKAKDSDLQSDLGPLINRWKREDQKTERRGLREGRNILRDNGLR